MNIHIRYAAPTDAPLVASLVRELAYSIGETSPITPAYVETYLAFPGCHILLAQEQEQVAGLLSFSIRPNLYHNGNTAMIEELVIGAAWRRQGVGRKLLEELLVYLIAQGCVEVSVTTMPDNEGAIRFYRAHGLVDEAIYLERHLIHEA